MSNVLAFTIAAIVTVPVPFFILFYFFARKWTSHKWKAIHQTAHVSAPVLIMSVHVLLLVIFEQSFFSYILIFLILLLGLSLIVQYKLHDEIHLRRTLKGYFRVCFLMFTFFYVGLICYGLMSRLIV